MSYFPSIEEVHAIIINSKKAVAPEWTFTAQHEDVVTPERIVRGCWTVDSWNEKGEYVGQEILKVDYKGGNTIIEYI